MTAETSLPRVVTALGSAQIVSWGTLFYTIAVLGPPMGAELGIGDVWLFGSFTAGLGLSGLLSPAVGRAIDARGGRQVLAAGSVLGALALATLAAAQGPWSVLAGWALAGVAMSAALYDPAFATLHQLAGGSYRRSVTALTLFGGFASTVFWPLSQWLQETGGWRLAFAVYALLHLVVCLPLHLLVVPRTGPRRRAEATAAAAVQPMVPAHGRAFAWLATALALASFLGSALSAHLMGFLTASGLTMREAVLVGAVVGPMQVAGRIMELLFLRRLAPLAVGTLAFAVLAIALLLFTQVHGVLGLALAFAVPYGWSHGVVTIVRGTVPEVLFGARGYGALLGRLAQPQFIARASAPVAVALVLAPEQGHAVAPWLLAAGGFAALVAYRRAIAVARSA
ncbi:MAG: MFS transporter [Betaproteobacteria bacterium]|nr:MFS transporter [Betaproteobacteria bacterium]